MKPIHEMSYEEILDIITIKRSTSNGDTVFYISKIASIDPKGFTYADGNSTRTTYHSFSSPQVYQFFLDKIETYEVYHFLAAQQAIDNIIETSLEDKVFKSHKQKLNELQESYVEHIRTSSDLADVQMDRLSYMANSLESASNVLKGKIANLETIVDSVLPTKAKDTITNLLEDLENIKVSYAKNLTSIQSDFKSVVSDLKSLFK